MLQVQTPSKIVIKTTEHPVLLKNIKRLLEINSSIQNIAFIGGAIFDSYELPEILLSCKHSGVSVIFGELKRQTTVDNLRAIVETGNVLSVNIHEDDPQLEYILQLRDTTGVSVPEVMLITTDPEYVTTPQDALSRDSYGFYNLADNMECIACLNLVQEPMIDYNGILIGCWENPDLKTPLNVFELGLYRTFKHPFIKKMKKMLKTGKINLDVPCARCPVFVSMIWRNKKLTNI